MRALVTGTTRGMGYEIASMLSDSCDLILGTSKKSEGNAARLQHLADLPAEFHYLEQDLANGLSAADEISDWAGKLTDKLDLLVLNAGFFIEGSLVDFSESNMRKNLEVNFLVNYFLVQKLLPLIKNSERKRIVIIGSTAAYEPYPLVPTYGVAKWALRGLAINLRKELAKDRVGVTFISPGATWTGMWEGEDLPRNRLLEPSDIAKAVKYVVESSEQAVIEEIILRPMEGDFHD